MTFNLAVDHLQKLREVSPIHYVDKLEVPVFLLLGKNDARVHHSQGVEYWRAVKGYNRVVIWMRMYDDNHTLDEVTSASNVAVSTAEFFAEVLEKIDH